MCVTGEKCVDERLTVWLFSCLLYGVIKRVVFTSDKVAGDAIVWLACVDDLQACLHQMTVMWRAAGVVGEEMRALTYYTAAGDRLHAVIILMP